MCCRWRTCVIWSTTSHSDAHTAWGSPGTYSLTHSLTHSLSWLCVVCSAGSVWVMSECLVWTWWFWMDSHRVTSTDTSVSSDTWETNTAQWVTHTDIIIVTQTLLTAVTDQCCVSQRWTLVPSSGDLLTSDLLSAEVAVCDEAAKTRAVLPGEWFVPRRSVGCWWSVSHDPLCVAAVLRWHPVIRRFGLSTAGLTSFLLTQQEMIKQHYPVKGETHTHIWDIQHTHTHTHTCWCHFPTMLCRCLGLWGVCVYSERRLRDWQQPSVWPGLWDGEWMQCELCCDWPFWSVLWLVTLICPLIGRSDLSFDWPIWSVLWLADLNCAVIGCSDLSFDWPIWTVIGWSDLSFDWPIWTVLWLADLICPVIGRSELWLATLICSVIGRSELRCDLSFWLADLNCAVIGRSKLWLAALICSVIGRSELCLAALICPVIGCSD